MTTITAPAPKMSWRPSANLVTLSSTIIVCVLLYAAAAWKYYGDGFFTLYYFIGLLRDNAYLGIAAIGLTFVILTGGIDLSVGAVVALTSIILAKLVERHGWHPALAVPAVLLLGTAMGTFMGFLIHAFRLAPFFVTLAGMFFARGCALLVSNESIGLTHPAFERVLAWQIPLTASDAIPFEVIIFLAVALIGMFLGRATRFGRFTYAIGGNEQSAVLMGLPVGRTKVLTYAFSGLCAALAGVVWAVSLTSGNATAAPGMELDAIAAVVIGGTLLSGGVGSVLGTVVGVLICAIIGAIITFASLNTWWTKIAVGGLLLAFIVLQKLLTRLGAVRAE